jgi:hypothetical protein
MFRRTGMIETKRLAFLAICLALAAAIACDNRPKYRKPPPPPPPVVEPPPQEIPITARETGAIFFVCAANHEEWEAIVDKCPNCRSNNDFYVDESINGFVCRACKQRLPNDKIVCDKCGTSPGPRTRVKIKHR